jgi:hypothetical protein
MKKILLSLGVALAALCGAQAQGSFNGETATFSWAVGNEDEATASGDAASALLSSAVSVGTDLTVSTYDASNNGGGTLAKYRPATSNPGAVEGDMIEYTVKMKKGFTFTPTSVTYDVVKQGTDAAYISVSYAVDEVPGDVTTVPAATILRNNNNNASSASLGHTYELSNVSGRIFSFRIFISNTANNKEQAIGNIKINGTVSGSEEVRSFTDFKINFRTDPYTVVTPEAGLPANVSMTAGSFHDTQHGYTGVVMTVSVDGPVQFTVGGCGYTNQATVKNSAGETLATLDTRGAGCDNSTDYNHSVVWTYNSETADVLTFSLGNYCPFFFAEACELIPNRTVNYFNVDGTLIGSEVVQGGSDLVYKYGKDDVTVAEGYAFRGWFNSPQASAVKIPEGTSVQNNLDLYAKTSVIEIPTSSSIYRYQLNATNFYIEDHEAIWTNGGSFHDTQHGFSFGNGNTLTVAVAGNAIVSMGTCLYSADANAVVTDKAGNEIATLPMKAGTDGAEVSFKVTSDQADTLTITFGGTTYIHYVNVFNVVEFTEFNENTGYFYVKSGDVSSFLIALSSANSTGDVKIFLENGVYDLGETALTSISGQNISIIGESTDNTIIVNAPPTENEGIGTTATLLNTSNNLYLQDLTIQNALDYYKTGAAGRAVCLQDKGTNTICKNVKMLSYQDTYYSNKASNFYWEDSEIHGTVDYLCGDGTVVYNRVKLVNESRSANAASGSDVVAAPNTTEGQKGYIFLDCSIESKCKDFTFARSWGGKSAAIYIRTTVLDNSLNASRWTAAGMNVAAYKFKEYKTMDKDGNVTTPATNIVNFTHSTGNLSYETVLSDDEAAEYTIANIYGTWAPDAIAAQLSTTVTKEDGKITWTATEGATAYAIVVNDQIVEIVPATTLEYADATASVRVANGRGGFGEVCEGEEATGVRAIETTKTENNRVFDLSGRRANQTAGLQIVNNQIILVK